ncbi:MAG: DUF1624 domain-containing protein [Rhodobacteraceae bacterium]|nr:DUF1624 domain-containing protein [Paracoccaceae bacterium]
MAVFHFCYDLEFLGFLPPGATHTGGLRLLSITVAGGFLLLSGVSLYLAHGQAIRWRAFGRRLTRIGAAAAAVTVATWVVFPTAFVYFGILHAIALASVIGLAFLRLPMALTALAAVAVFTVPRIWPGALDLPWLDWLGLTRTPRFSVDFEPVFPWLAPFLMGLALAKLAASAGLWDRLRATPGTQGRLIHALGWPGRHSLMVYLLHQPVLLALLWGAMQVSR